MKPSIDFQDDVTEIVFVNLRGVPPEVQRQIATDIIRACRRELARMRSKVSQKARTDAAIAVLQILDEQRERTTARINNVSPN